MPLTPGVNPYQIQTVGDLDRALADGPYAWPGGYPKYFITEDGGALSYNTVMQEYSSVTRAIGYNESPEWRVIGVDINWEDPDLRDDHTGEPIECAYCDDEDDTPSEPPPRQKTEHERMRDFFFPKRRGSYLMSLKSWR